MHNSRMLALLICVFVLGSTTLRAQTGTQGKPDTPQPKVHPGMTSWQAPYEPLTRRERWRWFVSQSVGPASLGVGRLTGVVTGNAMNASLGALWGEDPRYFRVGEGPLGHRLRNIVVMTFMARRSDGHLAPAYARYIGTTGNNFLTNAWRADSEATNSAALKRTAVGFAGRLSANAFREFWPDAKRLTSHRDH